MTSPFRRADIAARIAGIFALGVTAQVPAPALAQSAPQVSAAWIESLCPAPFSNEFALGKTEEEQAASALALFESPGEARAPFTSGSGVYTPWSRRLAGLSWESELEYGDHMEDWRVALAETLAANGWEQREDTTFGAGPGWSALAFEKTEIVGGNERTLVFRFDTFDKYSVDCGEADMLALYQREVGGELEPGSPRPVDPGPPASETEYLARFDCADPEVVARFAAAGSTEVAGPYAGTLISGDMPYDAQEQYEQRLGTWLGWMLLASGKISDEDFFELTREADDVVELDFEANLMGMIGSLENSFKGLEENDGARACTGYRTMLESGIAATKASYNRHRRINAAMIAEAGRLGIDID